MGHALQIFDFPEKTDRAEMQACADGWCRCNCDPWEHGGYVDDVTAEPVRLMRDLDVFPDFEAARDYLYSDARPDYETRAVRYRGEGKETKRTRDAEERVERLDSELRGLLESTLPARRKSALIGCAGCGSKISREHLGSRDYCPVCRESLRSKTDRERIAAKRDALDRAKRALRESRMKDGQAAPVRWAMVAEVHC